MNEKWQSLIDQQIKQAQKEGEFSGLPGEGKPLNLNEYLHTPEHLRAAYRIMKNANVVPDWMVASKELDEKRAQLLYDLQHATRSYAASEKANLYGERAWKRAQKVFREGAQAYNKQALNYNLKTPTGIRHKTQLDIEREIGQALENANP